MNNRIHTEEYLVDWWSKDGAWHVALPALDSPGSQRWTRHEFNNQEDALTFAKRYAGDWEKGDAAAS